MPTSHVDLLRDGAHALARDAALEPTLLALLVPLADALGMASAAVFVVRRDGSLELAAAIGLGDPAALATAVRNPQHPVARTATERTMGYDVQPTAPGGPALRSHLPLVVGDEPGVVLGVLAVAHDRPTDASTRAILEAVADLAAVAIARDLMRRDG
jgi:GAF domain-containing protein